MLTLGWWKFKCLKVVLRNLFKRLKQFKNGKSSFQFFALCVLSFAAVGAVPSGYGPKCTTVYDTVYSTECSTTYSKHCTSVPQTTYRTEHETACNTVYEKQCEQVWKTIPDKQCSTVHEKQCHDEHLTTYETTYKESCKTVPSQVFLTLEAYLNWR